MGQGKGYILRSVNFKKKKRNKTQKLPNGFYPGHHPYQKPSLCLKKGRREGSKQFSGKQDRRRMFA